MFINFFTLFTLLISFNLLADEITGDLKVLNQSEVTNSSNFILDYSYIRTKIKHEETSTSTSFIPYGKDSNTLLHRIGFGYEKEFFQSSRVSVTILTVLGIGIGEESERDGGASENFDYQDSITSLFGGAGVSLNYNHDSGGNRVQPFISAKSITAKNSYFLRYEEVGTYPRSVEIEYEEELSILESSIGVRFFNYTTNMMSIMALNLYSFDQTSFSGEASQGDTEFKLKNLAKIERESASFKIGFGILF
ncbi:MAG: hypothetical protein ACJAS4_002921 [Bacteriovoracaceae bacterium]|jgi:hypothetical protein